MNLFPLKILIAGCLGFLLINTSKSTFCMVSPQNELKVYQAMFGQMSDEALIRQYKEEFERLQKTFQNSAKSWDMSDVSQLPIFKTAIFKSIMKEIKKRQRQQDKSLLSAEQVRSADQFIREKEKEMNVDIKAEGGPGKKD